jgi:hypothetical protein
MCSFVIYSITIKICFILEAWNNSFLNLWKMGEGLSFEATQHISMLGPPCQPHVGILDYGMARCSPPATFGQGSRLYGGCTWWHGWLDRWRDCWRVIFVPWRAKTDGQSDGSLCKIGALETSHLETLIWKVSPKGNWRRFSFSCVSKGPENRRRGWIHVSLNFGIRVSDSRTFEDTAKQEASPIVLEMQIKKTRLCELHPDPKF